MPRPLPTTHSFTTIHVMAMSPQREMGLSLSWSDERMGQTRRSLSQKQGGKPAFKAGTGYEDLTMQLAA